MLKHLRAVAADLLVLTETHDGFNPDYRHSVASTPGLDGDSGEEHRWAAIWSNDRLEPIPTTDLHRTVVARVFPNVANTYIVFATVLPWRGSKWRSEPSKDGVAYAKALEG